ncbi:MAG: polyprenol monophosphomannose synthase [Patescibacteria group bacterium]
MKNIIIIPTYNEKANILTIFQKIMALEDKFDILFIDDNSPDGTGDILDELATENANINVIHRAGKQGLGTAYIAGFKYAIKNQYDLIFEMDADLSHDPKYLPEFLKRIENADILIGSRYTDGRISVINWPLWRLVLSRLATVYVKLITGMPVSDSTSGYKCFKRQVLEAINLDKVKSNGYSFQIEMNYRAFKKGFTISDVPIVFTERLIGSSKMSKRIIIEALLVVWRLKLSLW